MITEIQHVFCDNYFPPTFILVKKFKDESYILETTYSEPNDGIYEKYVVGIWKVKYKKLNPNYYLKGQL